MIRQINTKIKTRYCRQVCMLAVVLLITLTFGKVSAQVIVFPFSQLHAGCITTNGKTIQINTSPPTINASAPVRGNCNGNYEYQWMSSTDGTTYMPVPGATSASLASAPPISQATYYLRRVVCGSETAYTTPIVFFVGTTPYYNASYTATYYRNNCPAGSVPNGVPYTVAAGIFVSYESLADANQMAHNYANENGQINANNTGECRFYNDVLNVVFTRNNCPAGGTGTNAIYSVPVNTYYSLVSKAAANQLAQNDVNANGQNYANTNGSCIFYNIATSGQYTRNNCSPGQQGSTVTYTVPANTYNSTVSQADANQLAQNDVNANGQNYANANGTCCQPEFRFNGDINNITTNYIAINGSTVNFSLAFGYPMGQSFVDLGDIISPCGKPISARSIPVFLSGGGRFKVNISPAGDVTLQHVSGPIPTSAAGFAITYDVNINTYFSAQASGTFTRNNCPAGQTGSSVTYTVIQFAYSSMISQADADQKAQNDVNTNGQNHANANGVCTQSCTMTQSIPLTSNSLSSNGTTVTFTFVFKAPTNNYSSGTIGTITTVVCRPSVTRNVTVADPSNPARSWRVTITPSGNVSVTRVGGSPATPTGPPIVIPNGTYNL